MKTLRWLAVLFFGSSPAWLLLGAAFYASWKIGLGLLVGTAWITAVGWAWRQIDKEHP